MSRKSKSKKKDKPKYDENGKWVDQDSRILSGIRRAYRLSPQMQETLKAARVELPPKIKKNGQPGKRNQVRYRCIECDGLFSTKNVQVDHIDPATPLGTTIEEMSWDDVVEGIFCDVENLQVLCSTPKIRNGGLPSCHAKKSAEENWIRRKLAAWKEGGSINGVLYIQSGKMEIKISKLKEEYKDYLIDKAEKEEAKAERKRVREAKKLAKAKK